MCMLSHLCKLRDKLIGIQMVSKHQTSKMPTYSMQENNEKFLTLSNSFIQHKSYESNHLLFFPPDLGGRFFNVLTGSFPPTFFLVVGFFFVTEPCIEVEDFIYKILSSGVFKFTSATFFFIDALLFSGFLNIFLRIFGFFG